MGLRFKAVFGICMYTCSTYIHIESVHVYMYMYMLPELCKCVYTYAYMCDVNVSRVCTYSQFALGLKQ